MLNDAEAARIARGARATDGPLVNGVPFVVSLGRLMGGVTLVVLAIRIPVFWAWWTTLFWESSMGLVMALVMALVGAFVVLGLGAGAIYGLPTALLGLRGLVGKNAFLAIATLLFTVAVQIPVEFWPLGWFGCTVGLLTTLGAAALSGGEVVLVLLWRSERPMLADRTAR